MKARLSSSQGTCLLYHKPKKIPKVFDSVWNDTKLEIIILTKKECKSYIMPGMR